MSEEGKLIPGSPCIHVFDSRPSLDRALAEKTGKLAANAIDARGVFSVALSGGSMVETLARGLGSESFGESPGWDSWNVFWVDERVVSKESRESNFREAWDGFLRFAPIPPDRIFPVDTSDGASEGARRYALTLSRVMKAYESPPRFDLVLLGIGEDGHTASLFPGRNTLECDKEWVVPVFDSPKPPPERITMTLVVINNARHVFFVAKGSGKAPVISALFGPQEGRRNLPAAMVRPCRGELCYFFDNAAAAALEIPVREE